MELSTRRLGVGYLVGTAGLLGSVLLARLVVLSPAADDLLGTATGLGSALALGYAGYWLLGSSLDDDRIWTVATWGAAGISVVTFLALVVTVGPLPPPGTDVLISNVAAGGLVGVLIGGIRELNRELGRTARLHERNTVLNRVLRHNVRNDMNVVIGYADRLSSRMDDPVEELAGIRERAASVSALAAKARRAEAAFESGSTDDPIDVAEIVDRRASMIHDAYPEAAVSVDRPERARVDAGEEVDAIVRNLLENAVEHGSTSSDASRHDAVEHSSTGNQTPSDDAVEHGTGPSVDVTVRREGPSVEIRVADDGAPIPETERRVLVDGEESPLVHGSGMGLWLVKWLVDRHDGDLAFDADEDGNVVRVRLPRATDDGLLALTGNYFP